MGHAASVPPRSTPRVGPANLGNPLRPNRPALLLASSVYRTDTDQAAMRAPSTVKYG
jgi:hypothetical protein